MAATASEGTTGRAGANWQQSHRLPGANGKGKPLGGTEDHQNCLESEEVEPEEVILDIESESWPEPEGNHHQSWSQSSPHADALEPTEDEPMDRDDEDPEIEAIKAQAKELEDEVDKLKELQRELNEQMNMSSLPDNESPRFMSFEEKMKADSHSIYVGNVDYRATAEELKAHFYYCGSINRVTILHDKFSGRPKGFAYIEFSDQESARASLSLDDSLFRGRLIKVNPKRTNRPGMSTTHRGFPRAHYRGCTTHTSARSQSYRGFHSRCQGHVYRGSVHRGSAHRGSIYMGSVHRGSVLRGSAHRGSVYMGSVHRGSGHRGSAHRGTVYMGLGHRGSGHRGTVYMGSVHRGLAHRGLVHRGWGRVPSWYSPY